MHATSLVDNTKVKINDKDKIQEKGLKHFKINSITPGIYIYIFFIYSLIYYDLSNLMITYVNTLKYN